MTPANSMRRCARELSQNYIVSANPTTSATSHIHIYKFYALFKSRSFVRRHIHHLGHISGRMNKSRRHSCCTQPNVTKIHNPISFNKCKSVFRKTSHTAFLLNQSLFMEKIHVKTCEEHNRRKTPEGDRKLKQIDMNLFALSVLPDNTNTICF